MNYKKLMIEAENQGFSDLEIYESYNRNLTINVFNSKVDKNEQSTLIAITIRAIYQGKMASLHLENNKEKISFILENLKKNATSLTTEEEFFIFSGSPSYPKLEKYDLDFEDYSTADKLSLVLQVEDAVKKSDARIIMVPYCQYTEEITSVKIINSKGLNIKKTNAFAGLLVQAVAREGSDSQSSFEIQIKHKVKDLDPKTISKTVVKKALEMLNAKPVASKEYPVVIENEAMSNLLMVYQNIFSGEAAIKKITPLLNKIGETIASPLISIIDAPLNKEAIMNHPFDDEGVACYDKEVIKEGKFVTFLHNLKTAYYFKTESTGNGFKIGANVGVKGANLHIAPGKVDKQTMISSISEGLLITVLDGLHAGVNPISGDFSLKASGFLINNGKLTRPVSLIVIAGNFFSLLKEVETVGSDLYFSYYGVGSPSIKLAKIAVSGE